MKTRDVLRKLTVSDRVELALGREAVAAAVGKDALIAATASTSFDGGKKVPRGIFHPYVFVKPDGRYVVASPSEMQIRKSNFLEYASFDAAISHYERLLTDDLPQPPSPVPPAQWEIEDGVTLAVDTEGNLDRVSLATATQAASWQWSPLVADIVRRQIDAASLLLFHYAPHDTRLLRDAGLDVPADRVRCTLVAHQLLNPYRNRGLGYAAPMYIPCSPWKHMVEGDPELYSVLDAWHLLGMWAAMAPRLEDLRLWPIYFQDLKLQEMFHAPLGSSGMVAILPAWRGHQSPVTKAAACMEGPRPDRDQHGQRWLTSELQRPDGHITCGLPDPYGEALRLVCGSSVEPPVEAAAREVFTRRLCGLGPDVSRRGLSYIDDLLTTYPTRKSLADLTAQYPELEALHTVTKRQLSRDKFVSNPYGRKWYRGTAGQAQQFLILSTINDAIRRVLAITGIRPQSAGFGWVGFTDQADAETFLTAATDQPFSPKMEIL